MIWLTWRQFRVQAITAAAALAAFAVLLAATGPHLASLYAASGISGCQGTSCAHLASDFLQQLCAAGTYWVLYLLGVVLILLAPCRHRPVVGCAADRPRAAPNPSHRPPEVSSRFQDTPDRRTV